MADAPTRRDAARNRERLVGAARDVFARRGPDVPLEEIARAAGVSRTTLHRHFPDRTALAAAVLRENVADIEARAVSLAGADDGAQRLYHYLLDVQLDAPWLARMVAHDDALGTRDLADRTAAALDPLVAHAHTVGALHPGTTTQDVLLTLPMAMAAQAADALDERTSRSGRVRAILHRGLFTTDPPG
ncbi:TetR/AcrR family transcriptional regulator [Isoptericola cucumis]|uniref:TetR family transcriptional regulator n=1 Tax=Isoptericola cucumis TaxID=1776856 RepID=A0ABQ2B9B2_9MICO|nr:TetR/AcrR family transcriptional regulator [Isoptericola cucumis]GGI10849.1 TetR family transcriptional regulator [Isoptericola cucumis]